MASAFGDEDYDYDFDMDRRRGSSPYARDLRGFFPLRKRYEAKRNLIDAFTR